MYRLRHNNLFKIGVCNLYVGAEKNVENALVCSKGYG
jgi:hypothetical protein